MRRKKLLIQNIKTYSWFYLVSSLNMQWRMPHPCFAPTEQNFRKILQLFAFLCPKSCVQIFFISVFTGHTHGGQMFPISIGVYLANPFFVGLYEYKDRHVYVSSGTVFWGIPMRIFTSMEITEITLSHVD